MMSQDANSPMKFWRGKIVNRLGLIPGTICIVPRVSRAKVDLTDFCIANAVTNWGSAQPFGRGISPVSVSVSVSPYLKKGPKRTQKSSKESKTSGMARTAVAISRQRFDSLDFDKFVHHAHTQSIIRKFDWCRGAPSLPHVVFRTGPRIYANRMRRLVQSTCFDQHHRHHIHDLELSDEGDLIKLLYRKMSIQQATVEILDCICVGVVSHEWFSWPLPFIYHQSSTIYQGHLLTYPHLLV